MNRKVAPSAQPEIEVPAAHDWRTTDADEINKRRLRARVEPLRITEIGGDHPIFANFRVSSGSGMAYTVEIRSLRERLCFCTCVDFRINGLGTCKHVEGTLHYLEVRDGRRFDAALKSESPVIDIVPDRAGDALRIERAMNHLPDRLRRLLDSDGLLRSKQPEQFLEEIRKARIPYLRISQQVAPWLQAHQQLDERKTLLREYEQKVQAGEWPAQETLAPLYPYQREGMLHLAFKERSLLADGMGLGKTIQAIAACALLQRLGKVSRALVVAPASLKTEWEEQIQRFTNLQYHLVFGSRKRRLALYASPVFFTVTNYEQVVRDGLDINRILKPDVVILDEAQRIKNWTTKTAQAVKRLESRYAFVLTGTPIENRIDELYSSWISLTRECWGRCFASTGSSTNSTTGGGRWAIATSTSFMPGSALSCCAGAKPTLKRNCRIERTKHSSFPLAANKKIATWTTRLRRHASRALPSGGR